MDPTTKEQLRKLAVRYVTSRRGFRWWLESLLIVYVLPFGCLDALERAGLAPFRPTDAMLWTYVIVSSLLVTCATMIDDGQVAKQ